jgi:hypothetical protein
MEDGEIKNKQGGNDNKNINSDNEEEETGNDKEVSKCNSVLELLMRRLTLNEEEFNKISLSPFLSESLLLSSWFVLKNEIKEEYISNVYQQFILEHLRFLQELLQLCRSLPFPLTLKLLEIIKRDNRLFICVGMFFFFFYFIFVVVYFIYYIYTCIF